ncbi:hypothetical protein EVG20_g5580 [Dentipellis fragilis]|uniref:5'-Nucleotidase C-terminal domain-containing protein n=1 Tax=Dentipellis fragilis TaxID=205917 RepID=A0A4Y9YUR9_9AGAM|nr:hypothetical protein EVG20_g5580 [Dentipellis fragilis]
MIELPIIHWNDVYRVRPQKFAPTSSETIDVTQFAALIEDIHDRWEKRPDGQRDGLKLFSGDVFSPSVESSVTRGSHMVPVMNCLAPDVSLVGNHDFDFGYPHLCTLIGDTKFPWLLSNIIDTTTSEVPEHLLEYYILERKGIRIGFIGLVEREWIGTVSSWPATFEYQDMIETGKRLSKLLRDPAGPHKCDMIIALTHARVPNDIRLAKGLLALTPSAQKTHSIENEHGIDIILGGHDHLYFVGRGVDAWEDYDLSHKVLGAEQDVGDVVIVKSGTDFRDLSEIVLGIEDTAAGSVRTKVIKRITGKRHRIIPGMRSSEDLKKILGTILDSVSSSLKAPLCKLTSELDVRSEYIRVEESASGDWFADILRHTYDDALCMKGYGGADGVLICAGMLRGDSVYGPGYLTLGDLLEILPFEDPLVVIEVDGQTLWDTIEASLETWPAQEGRFPVIAGFRVSWDSRRPPGQRVIGMWLQVDIADSESDAGTGSGHSTPSYEDSEPIKRQKGGRKYRIVTREYMAQGHDGFLPLKGQKYLIDDEEGQITSSVVRKYMLGAHFINKMSRLGSSHEFLNSDTRGAIEREKRRQAKAKAPHSRVVEQWKRSAALALRWSRSKRNHQDHLDVSAKEHMSSVDCVDGAGFRAGRSQEDKAEAKPDEDLMVGNPMRDGRLKDEGRQQ